MKKIRVGIDPGGTGFITSFLINSNESEQVIEYFPIPKIGKIVDIAAIDNFLKNIKALEGIYSIHFIIEDVHAIYGSSAGATFSFGHVVGVLEALIISNKIPFTKVQPKEWQKEMWQGIPLMKKPSSTGKKMVKDTKAMSLVAAKRLFPGEDLRKSTRAKNPDHNKVDSLLMAEYCKRKFN